MTTDSEVRAIWKEQPMTTTTITTRDLELREQRLERQVRRRNRFEYLAAAIAGSVLLAAGVMTIAAASFTADLLLGAGFLMLAAAMAFIGMQLYRRSGASRAQDPAQSGLAFHTARLARERDLLRSAWLWYVGPTVPGFLLIYGSMLLEPLVYEPEPADPS